MKLSILYGALLLFVSLSAFTQPTGREALIKWIDDANKRAYAIKVDSPKFALALARQALISAKGLSYQEGQARALSRLGMAHKVLGHYDSSLHYFQQSLVFREVEGLSQSGIAAMHTQLGGAYIEKGMYARALSHLQSAVALREELANQSYLAAAYNDLALVQKLRAERKFRVDPVSPPFKEVQIAIWYYQKSLSLYAKIEDRAAYADICNKISSLFRMQARPDSTLFYLSQAESIFTSLHQTNVDQDSLAYFDGLTDTYIRKGRIHDYQKAFGQAFEYHERAKRLSIQTKDSLSLFMALNNMGEHFRLQSNHQIALTYYNQALTFSKNIVVDPVLLKTLYLNLASTYDALGDLPLSFVYFRKGMDLNAQIILSEEQARIEDAEENIRLEASFQQIETERRHQRTMLTGTLLGAGVVTLLLLFILRVSFQRQKMRNLLFAQREKEHQETLLKHLETTEQKILHEKNELQEKLLNTLSRELHDNLGASLVAAKVNLENLKNRLTNISPQAQALFKSIHSVVKDVYADIRKISKDLNNLSLEGGLISSLKELCEKMNAMDNSPLIKLTITGQGSIPLSPRIELHIFRIIHESLINVIKHAQAKTVDLQLILAKSTLNVTIEDDGIGFDPVQNDQGLGLKNIRSRVDELKGALTLDSSPGKGTTIFIDVPVSIQINPDIESYD